MLPGDILFFDNITMAYGDVTALDQVSFTLREGEIFGYIGPNGAGKTTTIKIMVGLIRDFAGGYRVLGTDAVKNPTVLPSQLGYLPQQVAFQEWRTVDMALKTLGELSGLNAAEVEEGLRQLLPLLDLMDVRQRKISELSGGTIQKVGLAQALLHRPRLLVLDEPLNGLDPTSRSALKALLRQISRNGTTIFFSSHILSDVQDIAGRIGIINRGRILRIGTMDELQSHLSPGLIIEIHLSGDSQAAAERLCLPAGVEAWPTGPDRLRLRAAKTADLDIISDDVLSQLLRLNYHVRCFKPVDSDLDEVFLRYVGGE